MFSALDRIRQLAESGELLQALDQLIPFLRGLDAKRDLIDETIVLSSRLERARSQRRRGEVSNQEVEQQLNVLQYSLLDLLRDVERETANGVAGSDLGSVEFEPPDDAALEKIIGSNNLRSIGWLKRGIQVSRSVCRLVGSSGIGSGFLLGEGLIATNHHVLPNRTVAVSCRVELGFEEDESGALQKPVVAQLDGETYEADPELDYAVVRLAPGCDIDRWGHISLAPDADVGVGDHVTIIQHPSGGPKQIAMTANQVVSTFKHRLHYVTDTMPGSSGSPVLNDEWNAVAIHRAGGNLKVNKKGDRMFVNEGVLIPAIVQDCRLLA